MPAPRRPGVPQDRPNFTVLSVVPKADRPEVRHKVFSTQYRREDVIQVPSEDIQITSLEGGMESGRASVAILVKLPTGKLVFAETSLANFRTVTTILNTAHPRG